MDPDELGPPIAFLAVEDGTPVYDSDGNRIGVTEHVMAEGDIFEGLVIHTHPLPGRHLFADADQVGELRERGVVLSVNRDALSELGEKPPKKNEVPLEARLRRAWDWLSRRA